MTALSHGLKGVTSTGLAALICIALAGCPAVAPSDEQTARSSPDLQVTSPAVSDSGPAVDARFTLSATVRNAGDGASEATTLRYYRSTDAAITRSDTEVGTDAVAALAASGNGGESVELVAPSTPGRYYYGACVDAVRAETDATDNCSTSVKVTVQATVTKPQDRRDQQDLVVMSPSVSDSAPAAGTQFTLSVAVSNAGGEAAAATAVRYYQSADATITTSDTEVGTEAMAELAATGTRSQSVELVAPSTPGTYHYGACVDAVADESDTTNNCSASVPVTVPEPEHPELVVTSPSVSDSGPAAGAEFTLSVTVRNAGGGPAAATAVRYYQSADATITTSDTEVGTGAVAELAATGTRSQSVELVAPSTPGTYHYGACVDAVADESDMTNNCSASVPVTVPEPEHPELVVTLPSVSDRRPVTGTSFRLSATVRNDGDGTAAATTLRYYRSTDATITTSDTEVGTGAVAELAPSGSGSQSVDLVAPSTQGTYYYGACVDAVADESDRTNNCSPSVEVSVQVTVTEPQGYPDLMVTSRSVSDRRPVTGTSFRLSATVSNDGDGTAAATTLRYYRSTDATITTSDTEVGTNAIAGLGAEGSSSGSVDVTAPATARAYYYGACVDAVTDESDTTNNCSASVKVDVEEPKYPDLEVGTPTVDDTSPQTGATITLSATVNNAGDGESAAATLRYYRSTDATITTSDTSVGTDSVGALAASGSSAASISLTAPATAGAYYYGACVDAVSDESDTTDNCSTSVQVDVEEPKYPDLEVGTPTVDDASPQTGATFTLSATVSNAGAARSAAATLRYYRSMDATVTTSDTPVGTDSVGALAASGTSAESISLTAPATAGAYYYGACVDAVTDESDRTNNCSASVKVDVEEPKYPDLEVGTPTVDDTSPETGATLTLSATVSNAGDARSAAATLRYYRSMDATITTSDTPVGTDSVGALAASGSSAESISLTAPATAGAYHYGACVDAVSDESDTTDNCSTSVQVDVEEPKYPDLEVGTPTVDDTSPQTGATFTLSATVSNAGDGESAAATLRYYRSTDATITTSDAQVGTDSVGALAASGSSAESISVTAPATAGAYHYGACVDAVSDESDTTDNCSTSVQVDVEEPKYPDLEVGTPTVDDTSPQTGATFTLSATVSNAGDGESAATTLRYYRSTDATITTSDAQVGTDSVGALAASGTSAESISLTAPATAGAYHYGACVDGVTGESDTTNNCSSSVAVTVTDAAEESDSSALALASLQVSGGASTMYPDFAGDILHYALACEDPDTIQVSARSARSGARLTLLRAAAGDNQTAIGTLDVQVTVDDDHDLAIELTDDGESVTYVVHCTPTDFPGITVLHKTDQVAGGLIFATPRRPGTDPAVSYLAILDNNGVPRFQRPAPSGYEVRNFRRHPDGTHSIFVQGRGQNTDKRVELLNAQFETTTTVRVVAPLTDTDEHDFVIVRGGTGAGNYLLVSRDLQSRDLSAYGLSTSYTVRDSVIQEITPEGTQVFIWNSWDHRAVMQIGNDCNLNNPIGDYAHINSLQVVDGDIIASFRHCDQVLRIDRSGGTGAVEWKLGGTAPPEGSATEHLEVVGDPAGEFCSQHHATVTDSGSIVLFDNGVYCLGPRKRQPKFTRVVEYDISSGTEARYLRSFALPEGNGYVVTQGGATVVGSGAAVRWLIAWGGARRGRDGSAPDRIDVSEVDPATGTAHLHLEMSRGSNRYQTYRVYRYAEADVTIPLDVP